MENTFSFVGGVSAYKTQLPPLLRDGRFTELLPGNALIKSVAIQLHCQKRIGVSQ
jgi:hypothetical protein